MFRQMRRGKQALSKAQCEEILQRATCGVLAVLGDGGYPYAVPLSYLYADGKLYFHCAKEGHKLDALLREPKASFCVVDRDEVIPQEYTTYFCSVIAFGKVQEVVDETKKGEIIDQLALRYAPHDTDKNRSEAIRREWSALCVLQMTVEQLSGKEAIELVRRRKEEGREGQPC